MAEENAKSGVMEITAKVTDGGEATILYNFGASLEEMVKLFDESTVFANARANMKIIAQAAIRRLLTAGKTQDEVVETMKTWKPGVALERVVDPKAALLKQWATMDPAAKQAFLAQLKAQG